MHKIYINRTVFSTLKIWDAKLSYFPLTESKNGGYFFESYKSNVDNLFFILLSKQH